MNFNHELEYLRQHTDAVLKLYLERLDCPSVRLHQAINYTVLNGGKRLRPILVYLTGKCLGLAQNQLDPLACAIEFIHCYSLAHDDLPAMDDDDLRRGKPACHIAFDEATAILAGDALQPLSFAIIANTPDTLIAPALKLKLISKLANACGAQGMAGGQALDLEPGIKTPNMEQLTLTHELKTGCLLSCCVEFCLQLAAPLPTNTVMSFRKFAYALGMAFQVQDDYLDRYGETNILGKPQGSDELAEKTTFASYYSKQKLFSRFHELYDEARDSIGSLKLESSHISDLITYLRARQF